LAQLVDSAGADVVGRVVQRRDAPDPATFVGRGKAEEIAALSRSLDADTVVFDDELSPAQHRNLEKLFGRTAIDRTAVILDIFAQNARSPEGKAQVELALLRYRLPRLRGRGTALSQQAGGINVEWVTVTGDDEGELLDFRVYERGAGETLACGTGSVAAAAAARSWDALDGDVVRVRNPGGMLEVTLGADERATTYLAGPVRKVADVDIHPGMLS